MTIRLFPEKCIACGLCQTYSPVFDYDDEGIVRFAESDELSLPIAPDADTLMAIKSCPTKALQITD